MTVQLTRTVRRRWRRAVARYRRLLAAGLLAAAVAAAVNAAAPDPPAGPPTRAVLVAAHDLPAGRVLGQGDVEQRVWPAEAVPRGAQSSVHGRVLASGVRGGEPITDARLTGPGLLTGQPAGTRAVTVQLSDPSAASLIRAGDRVDVLAAGDGLGGSRVPVTGSASSGAGATGADVVVEGAVVLAAPSDGCGTSTETADPLGGLGVGGAAAACEAGVGRSPGVLLLAVDSGAARRLAEAASVADRSLSVAIRP